MSDTPELDQVADARRRIAAHARFPVVYWVLSGVALVIASGLPIWFSLLPGGRSYIEWALVAIVFASAIYSWSRRRRSGVYLPKRIGSYPGALPFWLASIVIMIIGFAGINVLVNNEQLGIAFLVLPVVAIAVFGIQIKIRSAMVRDIEEGRVRP
ncbi:hypothetical protein OOZ19_11400 [Saccharopolyspora sp. NFXS83]|uniref:hypothetical protein n=1 Tax=Saccharopolyspora sp. NFXS83 TaxID=2993560 RepID=UPI00224AF6CF|nr:hypothetical protein [Saccharopolyspora sp. NFXS83]MCX2730846.1 hypothetical protein [Saccharopolyspora sp. NFXS83]